MLAAFVLFCQPIEFVYIAMGMIDGSTQPMSLGLDNLWGELFTACANGGLVDVAATNLKYGLQINFGWALEHGRLTQTLCFFLIGMLLGRKGMFIKSEKSMTFWRKAMQWAVLLFVSMQLLLNTTNFDEMQTSVGFGLSTLITAWRNFAMTTFYVSGFTLLYYCTRVKNIQTHLSFIGKMSLTDYLLQRSAGADLVKTDMDIKNLLWNVTKEYTE